jgi:hypothetical protein
MVDGEDSDGLSKALPEPVRVQCNPKFCPTPRLA